MKSKEAIEIEFAKAIGEAEELENVGAMLVKIANSIVTSDTTALEKAWKGGNSIALAMKSRTLSSDILDTAQNLFTVAKGIRNTAELVYRAEKAAVLIALN